MGSKQKNTVVTKFEGERTVKAGTIIISEEQVKGNTAKTWLQSSKGSTAEHTRKSKD